MQNNILVKSLIFGIITVLIGAVLIQTTTGDNPPTAPSSLVATTYSQTQINITWSDNSNNEDGFEIQYSTDSASFALLDTVGAGSTTMRIQLPH